MNRLNVCILAALLSIPHIGQAFPIRPNQFSGGGGFWAMYLTLGKGNEVWAEIGGARNGSLEHYDVHAKLHGLHDGITLDFSPELRFEGRFIEGGTEISGFMFVTPLDTNELALVLPMHLQARVLPLPSGSYFAYKLADLGRGSPTWIALRMGYYPAPGGSGLGSSMLEGTVVTRTATSISINPDRTVTIRYPGAEFRGKLTKDRMSIPGTLFFFDAAGVVVAQTDIEFRPG
jgi:hypothetical protein